MLNIFFRNLFFKTVIIMTLFLAWTGSGTVDVEVVAKRTAPALGGIFVIGDSTTWRLTGEYDNTANLWELRHPDWTVDGVGGRNVTRLPDRISWHLANVDSNPSIFVMALGTNPAAENDTWNKASYKAALALLPASTKVVLVIPVRAARMTVDMRVKSDEVTKYATYLREIAKERSGVITAEWRSVVMNDPTRDPNTGVGDLLMDGIHQRNPHGRHLWMDIVDAAVERF